MIEEAREYNEASMNWITNLVRPKIQKVFGRKKEVPDNLWVSCPSCGEMLFRPDLEQALWVCHLCDAHLRLSAIERARSLFDDGKFHALSLPETVCDPLKFRDQKKYVDRLKQAQKQTGLEDAFFLASGLIEGIKTAAAIQDFSFIGGSLGIAAGSAFIKGARYALHHNTPFVCIAAAGGARMQEGILSLMQMPRTIVALQRLSDAHLPYIVILTDPTMGGVTASYAMLGDIHLAEPGAIIGFTGRRVIEQTIKEQLPHYFQKSEYLYEHGYIDSIVHRHNLKQELGKILNMLMQHRS